MLCTKIVFTGEYQSYKRRFSDFLNTRGIPFESCRGKDSTDVCINSGNEELYEICCELGNYILESDVSVSVSGFLRSDYPDCFNSDETRFVCDRVCKRDFFGELPGRMYVYMQTKKSINPFAFYTFMCRDMNMQVRDTTVEEADKLVAVNENREFIDLLRNFAFVSADSFDKVELKADSSGIRIASCIPEERDVCTEYAMEDEDILAELVTMNPKCIEIHGKEEFLKNEISYVITAVFEGRIQYK